MERITLFLAAIAVSLAIFTGCDSLTASSPVEGQMRVLMTDAPADIAEAHVTIERVELIGGQDGPIVLSNEKQEYDLLELQNGVTAKLADVPIPEGVYSQLRLIVADEAHLVMVNGDEETLKVPSGTQTGIKILLPEFAIEAEGDAVEVLVDFDVYDSLVKAGASEMYVFRPVIKPVYIEVNGVQTELEEEGADESEE